MLSLLQEMTETNARARHDLLVEKEGTVTSIPYVLARYLNLMTFTDRSKSAFAFE